MYARVKKRQFHWKSNKKISFFKKIYGWMEQMLKSMHVGNMIFFKWEIAISFESLLISIKLRGEKNKRLYIMPFKFCSLRIMILIGFRNFKRKLLVKKNQEYIINTMINQNASVIVKISVRLFLDTITAIKDDETITATWFEHILSSRCYNKRIGHIRSETSEHPLLIHM